MTISVFVGTSLDGFIARPDGAFDFLPDDPEPPVLIGEGIPLFGSVPHDIALRHIATRSFPSGLVQSEYEVVR